MHPYIVMTSTMLIVDFIFQVHLFEVHGCSLFHGMGQPLMCSLFIHIILQGVSEESVVANGADTHEHTDGNRSNAFLQQTHKENRGKKKSKGVLHQKFYSISDCKVLF